MAFEDAGLVEIAVPDSVKAIHPRCFCRCKNLEGIRFVERSQLSYLSCSTDIVSGVDRLPVVEEHIRIKALLGMTKLYDESDLRYHRDCCSCEYEEEIA